MGHHHRRYKKKKKYPKLMGARLPFELHTQVGGSTPTTAATIAGGQVGRTIAWNWIIPPGYRKAGKVPSWLLGIYAQAIPGTDDTPGVTGSPPEHHLTLTLTWSDGQPVEAGPVGLSDELSYTSWWVVKNTNTMVMQQKIDPIVIVSTDPGTLVDYAWIYLDLPLNITDQGYTCAEVVFYESPETATSARVLVTAKVSGAAGNSITTTTTATGAAWTGATLSGGADLFYNATDGDTLTITSTSGTPYTYTLVSGALNAVRKVKIGAQGSDTLLNIMQAINAGTGGGVIYASGTTANPLVVASTGGIDGGIFLTALSGSFGDSGNGIAVSGTSTYFYFNDATLTGGIDGTFFATPGFTFTSIVSAIDNGTQGLEVQTSSDLDTITLEDLRFGLWDKAQTSVFVVDWASPSGGTISLFGGQLGKITYGDDGFVDIEIDGLMSRKKNWPAQSWSPTCRADLGDEHCKFPIDTLAQTFTITTVVSQTEIKSLELSAGPEYWMNGVVEILDGPNAGAAIELVYAVNVASTTTGPVEPTTVVKAQAQVNLRNDAHVLTLGIVPVKWRFTPTNGQTLTVNGKVYTFVTTLTGGNGQVLINGRTSGFPASLSNQHRTLTHLADAINLAASGAAGYGSGTTLHPTVAASAPVNEHLTLFAKVPGSAGNAYTLATNATKSVQLSGPTFNGGVGAATTGTVDATASATLKLAQPFPFPLTVGTHAKIWPGCQKRFVADCHDRFKNTINFRGEPFAPTSAGLKVE